SRRRSCPPGLSQDSTSLGVHVSEPLLEHYLPYGTRTRSVGTGVCRVNRELLPGRTANPHAQPETRGSVGGVLAAGAGPVAVAEAPPAATAPVAPAHWSPPVVAAAACPEELAYPATARAGTLTSR